MHTVPERRLPTYPLLVRYFDERALDTLFHGELKITAPSEFNDPFEFRLATPASYSAKQLRDFFMAARSPWREWWEQREQRQIPDAEWAFLVEPFCSDPDQFRQHIDEHFGEWRRTILGTIDTHFGLACFSEEKTPLDEDGERARMLMWSHYAAKHQGLLIEFDFDGHSPIILRGRGPDYSGYLFNVDYPKMQARPEMKLSELCDFRPEALQRTILRWAKVKSQAWEYEQEWRLLVPFSHNPALTKSRLVNGRMLHFFSLRSSERPQGESEDTFPVNIVTRVVIGCRARPKFRADVSAVLESPRYRHVHVQEARLNGRYFGLDYVDLRKPWG